MFNTFAISILYVVYPEFYAISNHMIIQNRASENERTQFKHFYLQNIKARRVRFTPQESEAVKELHTILV
jgi:hypothetical protein